MSLRHWGKRLLARGLAPVPVFAPTHPRALLDHCGEDLISGWIRPPDGAETIQIVLEQPDRLPLELEIGDVRPVPAGSRHVALKGSQAAVAVRLLAGHARVVLRWSDAAGTSQEAVAALAPRFRASATKFLEARLDQAPRADEQLPPKEIWESVLAAPPVSPPAGTRTSRFHMIEGLVSRDETTIIGKNGFLFLHRGHNNLIEQYMAGPLDEERAKGWLQVIQRRRQIVTDAGASFLQILIPEKASTLPHLLPSPQDTPTYLSRRLREQVADARLPDFMDVAAMIPPEEAEAWWRRTDSHMASVGILGVFQSVLAHLGYEPPEVGLDIPVVRRGNLGDRFPGLVDISLEPTLVGLWAEQPQIRIHRPGPGNTGVEVVSHNPLAPIAKSVFVCGSSFFATGTSPDHMMWWFSRWFRDVYFIWTGELNVGILEALEPDHVICQTIERFLPSVPEC